jgi:hypothetical protein
MTEFMKLSRVPLVFLLAQPWSVQAAAPAYSVDPAISTVRSGGFWESKQHHGHYRVVIAHLWVEHIQSNIRIEWMLDATPSEPATLERSEVLQELLLGSIDVESMEWSDKGTEVVLSGPLHDGSQYRCRLHLGTDGSIAKGAGC